MPENIHTLRWRFMWERVLRSNTYRALEMRQPFRVVSSLFFPLIYDMKIFLGYYFFESRNFTRPQNIYRVWHVRHVRHVMLDMTSNFPWFMLCSWKSLFLKISENYFWIIASIFVLFHHSFSSFKIPIIHMLNLCNSLHKSFFPQFFLIEVQLEWNSVYFKCLVQWALIAIYFYVIFVIINMYWMLPNDF